MTQELAKIVAEMRGAAADWDSDAQLPCARDALAWADQLEAITTPEPDAAGLRGLAYNVGRAIERRELDIISPEEALQIIKGALICETGDEVLPLSADMDENADFIEHCAAKLKPRYPITARVLHGIAAEHRALVATAGRAATPQSATPEAAALASVPEQGGRDDG